MRQIEKERLLDNGGKPLTQSLFIEFNYNTDYAVYSWGDEDKVYKGKTYPSLKRLYLECNDPTEYTFAKKWLLGWKHWQRLNENKLLKAHFDEWREELELAIRSDGVRSIIDAAEDNYQAAKWLADRGWEKNPVGRPKKEDNIELDRILEDHNDIVRRMSDYKTGSN